MAKDFNAKKSNSHMNGFTDQHINAGHKNMGKVPYSDSVKKSRDPFAPKKKRESKADKMEDKNPATDFDRGMEDQE